MLMRHNDVDEAISSVGGNSRVRSVRSFRLSAFHFICSYDMYSSKKIDILIGRLFVVHVEFVSCTYSSFCIKRSVQCCQFGDV